MNTFLELAVIKLKVFLRELMIFKSPRGHSDQCHSGNSEMSEFFGRKIPNAVLPFSCNFNHNSPGAKYFDCVKHLVYIR